MALGELTKQIAQQALLSATNEPPPAPAAPQGENLGAVILGQVAAMQKALKEDEELAVWYQSPSEKIRVVEIFLPSPRLAVLTGFDPERSLTRIIAPVESLQLVAKSVKVQPGSKPVRVGLVTPKPAASPRP
jgi:hypothetical protein